MQFSRERWGAVPQFIDMAQLRGLCLTAGAPDRGRQLVELEPVGETVGTRVVECHGRVAFPGEGQPELRLGRQS